MKQYLLKLFGISINESKKIKMKKEVKNEKNIINWLF